MIAIAGSRRAKETAGRIFVPFLLIALAGFAGVLHAADDRLQATRERLELLPELGAALQAIGAADLAAFSAEVRDAVAGRMDKIARIDLPDIESEPLPLAPPCGHTL